ncbi:MAG: hypothetical protein NUV59_03730 [Patescibacteria group bacterium]|nr:hypothetical protein [Patescibacteria group bacterium]
MENIGQNARLFRKEIGEDGRGKFYEVGSEQDHGKQEEIQTPTNGHEAPMNGREPAENGPSQINLRNVLKNPPDLSMQRGVDKHGGRKRKIK